MLYFANPTGEAALEQMRAGRLGFIDTPLQGNIRPPGVTWCADNGCFSEKWNEDHWWRFLVTHASDAERCLFAVAPDVVGDAWRTHIKSLPWLPRIRELGYPVAYVAQNGIEQHPMMPWSEFDVLFVGGCHECPDHGPDPKPRKTGRGAHQKFYCRTCGVRIFDWKLGPVAAAVVAEARARGKWVHLGRVNSFKRLDYGRAIGCQSADGTFLVRGSDVNLPRLLSWLDRIESQPELA